MRADQRSAAACRLRRELWQISGLVPVIRRPNPFLQVIEDFNSFADAMANKLAKEIDVARDAAERQMSSVRRRLDGPSAVRLVELAD